MIIQREFRSGNYHVANDAPFLNSELSWAAKGVLGYLFSKPDDWTPRMYDIVQNGPCEKYKIKSIFEELEEHGYLHRRKVRDDEGKFNWEVKVFDHPRSDPGWSEPTPNSAHPGQNGGGNKKDSQSDGQAVNNESEAPAREENEPPCTVDEAVEKGQMIGVSEELCREWWHYHNAQGWKKDFSNIGSAVKRWKFNDIKFNGPRKSDEKNKPAQRDAIESGGHHWDDDGYLRDENGDKVYNDRGYAITQK